MSQRHVNDVLRDYPRIYFACHRRHRRDEQTGALLSQHQASILDHLDPVQGTTLGDLAEHMGVTAGTMSVQVDRLVKGGFVHRVPDSVDKRRVHLRLTEQGSRLRQRDSVLDPALVSQMLDELSAKDRLDALRGLALLARAATQSTKEACRARGRRGTTDAA